MASTPNSVHRTYQPNQPVGTGQVAGYIGTTADAFVGIDPATVLPGAPFVAAPAAATSLAAPAGGTGTAAGGWDTAANRDLAIVTINALRTDVAALITEVGALRSSLLNAGIMAPS